MSFYIDNEPCLDPRRLYAQCVQHGLPTNWYGNANYFGNRLGGAPGEGKLIMSRDSMNKLNFTGQQDDYRKLIISDGTRTMTSKKIVISGECECLTPGWSDSPYAAYLVPIADKRWLHYHRGIRVTEMYNLRDDVDGSYVTSTLNSGTAWTWQQIVTDLWPSELGTAPTLPFTPHGTPESFWYQRETKLKCLDHFLARIGCMIKYDQVADEFSIVRLGLDANDVTQNLVDKWDNNRIYDQYSVRSRTVQLPKTVRTEFRVRKPYGDGTSPYYTVDNAVSPTAAGVADSTYILLQDDLSALWSGSSITNSSTLTARATERANDYTRIRRYYSTNDLRIFAGHFNFNDALGGIYSACVWKELGGTDGRLGRGMLTEIASGNVDDDFLANWHRHEYYGAVSNVCPIEDSTVVTTVSGTGLSKTGNTLTLGRPIASGGFVFSNLSFI